MAADAIDWSFRLELKFYLFLFFICFEWVHLLLLHCSLNLLFSWDPIKHYAPIQRQIAMHCVYSWVNMQYILGRIFFHMNLYEISSWCGLHFSLPWHRRLILLSLLSHLYIMQTISEPVMPFIISHCR